MEEKIKQGYYDAYRKYQFNSLMNKEEEKIYFMGMYDAFASLYSGKTDIFEEVREKAKNDAYNDYRYYKNYCC